MVTPRKHAKRKTCTYDISNISAKKRYALLTNHTDNVDFSMQHVTEKRATNIICDVDKVKIIDNYQIVESKSKKNININIVNLSNC